VHFLNQRLQAQWRGRFTLSAELGLDVLRGRNLEQSENLRFALRRLQWGGTWWPIAWLQPLVEDFNPLLKYSGFPTQVVLGKLHLERGRLILGTEAEK